MLLSVVFIDDEIVRIARRPPLNDAKASAKILKLCDVDTVQGSQDLGSSQRHDQNADRLGDVRLLAEKRYKFFQHLPRRDRERRASRLEPDISSRPFRALSRILQQASAQANESKDGHNLNTHHQCAEKRTHPTVFQVFNNQLVDHCLKSCGLNLTAASRGSPSRPSLQADDPLRRGGSAHAWSRR